MKQLLENYRRFFTGRGVNTSGAFNDSKLIKEDEDWYSDDPNAPKPEYGDDDQFDSDKAADHEEFGRGSGLSKEDYIGAAELLKDLYASVEEYHRDVAGPIQDAAAETDDPQYDMQEKQISRYFQTIFKSVENLQKFLEKQSRRV